jgi:hypothetical protein
MNELCILRELATCNMNFIDILIQRVQILLLCAWQVLQLSMPDRYDDVLSMTAGNGEGRGMFYPKRLRNVMIKSRKIVRLV